MKKFVAFFGIALLTCSFIFAQNPSSGRDSLAKEQKGSFLSSDKDSVSYLIGAPADNWFLTVGAGAQTYFGNEVESSARLNPITPHVYIEVGKWLIPSLALSLNVNFAPMYGQTRYPSSPHPFVRDEDIIRTATTREYEKFKAYTFFANGLVTLDWTNLCCGYQKGSTKKVHFLTPIGFGVGLLTNKVLTQSPKYENGARNFELDFSLAFIPEIQLSENIRLVPAIRFQTERGTFDYSYEGDPYDRFARRFDIQPSVTVGVKFNLSGTKEGASHKTKYSGEVPTNHVFVPAENSETVKLIMAEIEALQAESEKLSGELVNTQDKLAATAAELATAGAAVAALAEAEGKLSDAEKAIAALKADRISLDCGAVGRALNPMEEIICKANAGNLTSTYVYFPISSSKLDYNAGLRIEEFANIVKLSSPEVKFFIIGAADKGTGTEKANYQLSVSRCKAIYDKLVNGCGVDSSKLEMRPLGGIDEAERQELNRVGIVVEASEEMTGIVNKYSRKF